jgi:hypothetical protein
LKGGDDGHGQDYRAELSQRTERKEALSTATYREHRSIANMVKVMIRDYCGPSSMTIGEQTTLSSIDLKLTTHK